MLPLWQEIVLSVLGMRKHKFVLSLILSTSLLIKKRPTNFTELYRHLLTPVDVQYDWDSTVLFLQFE